MIHRIVIEVEDMKSEVGEQLIFRQVRVIQNNMAVMTITFPGEKIGNLPIKGAEQQMIAEHIRNMVGRIL